MKLTLRSLLSLILVMFTSLCALTVTSCSSDDDEPAPSDIVGDWSGTRQYDNPVGGTKYQYMYLTLSSDHTGSFEYESPVSYTVAYFRWSVSGNKIKCEGAYANTYGDVDGDFTITFEMRGDRLYPLERFSEFILTKDGSIETDGSGDEANDDSQLIYGVWLHSSGEVVVVFDSYSFTEYTLLSASSNIYKKKTEGTFSYDYRQNYVMINNDRFNVLSLTETTLQIKPESNNVTYNYKRGSKSDIPTNGEGSEDYRTLLEHPFFWRDKSRLRSLVFHHSNKITYMEESTKSYGSWGIIGLTAAGTYWISGKKINCTFDFVSWQDGKCGAKNYFPDWVCDETNSKVFTIESINSERLELRFENGKSYYFYPYLGD